MSEKYHEKEVYACEKCGKEWDTPGAAQTCYDKHRLTEALESVENHPDLARSEVIDVIEGMVERGELDREHDESDYERKYKNLMQELEEWEAVRIVDGTLILNEEWARGHI